MGKDLDLRSFNFSINFDIVLEKISGTNTKGKGKGDFTGVGNRSDCVVGTIMKPGPGGEIDAVGRRAERQYRMPVH